MSHLKNSLYPSDIGLTFQLFGIYSQGIRFRKGS